MRPAKVLLHAADEYGEVDAELRVGRDGIMVEIDEITHAFETPMVTVDAIVLAHAGTAARFVAQHRNSRVSIAQDGLALTSTIRPRFQLLRTQHSPDRGGMASKHRFMA